MSPIIERYRLHLTEIDRWFERGRDAAASDVACERGCSACCRGLFDISLLDAALLRSAFDRLPAEVRRVADEKARQRLVELNRNWPDFTPPYILNLLPDDDWIDLPEDDPTPCPLLGDDGTCLIYAARPMTCRLHGLPQLSPDGSPWHDEWCTRNFRHLNPFRILELRFDFEAFHAVEFRLLQDFSRELCGQPLTELDTLIPTALLIDFDRFDWPGWTKSNLAALTRHRPIY